MLLTNEMLFRELEGLDLMKPLVTGRVQTARNHVAENENIGSCQSEGSKAVSGLNPLANTQEA